MVILKINTNTAQEREIEIVDEKGTWQSGAYHIFSSAFLYGKGDNTPEPHDVNSTRFLGEINIDKEKTTWHYKGDKLNNEEQQEIASFIMDYTAPDGVY